MLKIGCQRSVSRKHVVAPLFFKECERVKWDAAISGICRIYTLLMTLLGILENIEIKTKINGLQCWVASYTAHPTLQSVTQRQRFIWATDVTTRSHDTFSILTFLNQQQQTLICSSNRAASICPKGERPLSELTVGTNKKGRNVWLP